MTKIKVIAVGPSDGRSVPTPTALYGLMNEIEAFQNDHTENLAYEEYETLSETATVLRTLGNVVSANDAVAYMAMRVQEAKAELAYYRDRFTEKS